MWYRVFGTNEMQLAPETIRSQLDGLGCGVTVTFAGGDAWLRAEIVFADTTPIHVERFLSSEEGIRAELNTWAAYLETCDYSPNFAALMEQMIRTKQLFTLRRPLDAANEVLVDNICLGLARLFARTTEGVYQVDGQGFFSADGLLLLQEY
jgi:hypothetical protein